MKFLQCLSFDWFLCCLWGVACAACVFVWTGRQGTASSISMHDSVRIHCSVPYSLLTLRIMSAEGKRLYCTTSLSCLTWESCLNLGKIQVLHTMVTLGCNYYIFYPKLCISLLQLTFSRVRVVSHWVNIKKISCQLLLLPIVSIFKAKISKDLSVNTNFFYFYHFMIVKEEFEFWTIVKDAFRN